MIFLRDLVIEIVNVDNEIGELDCAVSKLDIELIEVDVTEYEFTEFLLQQEFDDPLHGPPRESSLREVPRKHRVPLARSEN